VDTTLLDGEYSTRQARCRQNLPFAPKAADQTGSTTLRSTPPDAFAHDHDWQQVSWLAGHHL